MSESRRSDRRRGYEEEEPPSVYKRSSSYDRPDEAKRYRRGYGDEDEDRSFSRRGVRDSYNGDNDYYRNIDRRNRKDSYGEYSDDDWKCLECMTWNYPQDCRCARCGACPEEESSSPGQLAGDDELDEFGRARKKPAAPEWPPRFESNGSAFVFDARSSMFYHAESNFFYDPKSKLYYGNKQRVYYRYNEDSTVDFPFEEVQKVEASGSSATDLTAEPALATKPMPGSSKDLAMKGISIKLKTKSLGGTKNKKDNASDPGRKDQVPGQAPASRLQKKHAMDIDKWADRQVEKRVDAQDGTERTIQRTPKGEPVCLVCRRKFPSVEKLLHHERVSKLHKENLAKAAEQVEKDPPVQATAKYVDRAEQRRIMHGPETPAVALPPLPMGDAKDGERPPATLAPEENVGDASIGNQLLQKMGWQAGSSGSNGNGGPSMADSLKKDWERIEALAAQTRRKTTSSTAGLGT